MSGAEKQEAEAPGLQAGTWEKGVFPLYQCATGAGRIMSYTGYRSVEAEDCHALETVWKASPVAEAAPGEPKRRSRGPEPRAR